MLVLSRDEREWTVLTVAPSSAPTVIRVGIAELRPSKVRLAYEAPKHVAIVRGELMEPVNEQR